MTGYQEILTDPSYAGQIVTLTYPHIGNVGVNPEDVESTRLFAAGLVIRDLPRLVSNFRSTGDLSRYLARREHRRHRRHRHAQADAHPAREGRAERLHRRGRAIDEADDGAGRGARAGRAVDGGAGPREGRVLHGALRVDARARGRSAQGFRPLREPRFHVVAYDYGVKHNILRMLAERGCRLTVVPAQTPARDALALRPDGVFLSNGPGDPEPCDYAIAAIRAIVDAGDPDVRHLPRPPAPRPRLGRPHAQDEVRPPRREPPGARQGHRPGADHQPEPRLRGRPGLAARHRARRRTSRSSTAACRASRAPTSPPSASRAIRRRAPGRTTSRTCSTASCG